MFSIKNSLTQPFYPVIYDTAVSPKQERNPGDEGFFHVIRLFEVKVGQLFLTHFHYC